MQTSLTRTLLVITSPIVKALLKRARDAMEYAYIHGDHERMYHYETVINTLTTL